MSKNLLTIKETVNRIFEDILHDRYHLNSFEKDNLKIDLQMEPVELLELFAILSATFNVTLKPEDTCHFTIVNDIYEYIFKTVSPDQIMKSSQRLQDLKYVKIIADMAYKVGILTDNNLECLEANLGFKIRPNINIDDIKISCIYLMQDIENGCQANCAFCVQSKETIKKRKHSMLLNKKLIRFPMPALTSYLKSDEPQKRGLERICIQTVYNKETVPDLLSLVKTLRTATDISLTACCIPVIEGTLKKLKAAGLDMIVINYEVATPGLFSEIRGSKRKGPYTWNGTTASIDNALKTFGAYKVGSHLQIGLGESQKEALKLIQDITDKNAFVSLFAFRPLPGTALEHLARVPYASFHKLQLASYLIQNNLVHFKDMLFDWDGNILSYGLSDLKPTIWSGAPFKNRGCPGCNRVFFDTDPGERFYTYPRNLTPDEIHIIEAEILSEEPDSNKLLHENNVLTEIV